MDERVPEIRFKGFEGPWELKKLGEIADIVGGGTPSTGIPEYWSGNISWYSPAEIGNKVFVSESQRKITKAGYNHCSANILPPGTVLFTSRAGIGKTAILEKEGCTNQGFQSIIPHKEQLDSYFIYSRSAELKQYGETVGAGSTFVEVSGKQMADMDILIPTVFEQRVIGGYFRNLDNSIFFTQQKLDQLNIFKKACLEKMFPKEGETVPEIRFKGFEGPWKKCTLGDVGKARSGIGFPDSEQGGKMGMPFYKVSDMNILGNETEMTNANNYVTEVQIIRNGWSPIEAVPAIIFAKVGAAVMLNRKRLCRAPFLLDNNTMAYSLDESKWDAEFAKALFANVDLTALVQVGALPSYNASDVEGIEISLAPLTEQKQIGRYFKELDNQIYLSQKKLDQLKNLKKALLDKMFV